MKISQKLDYASRALVYLARQYDGQSVLRADDIAESESIPSSFLAQILNELKRSGLVISRRGKTGGWRLAVPPSETSLLSVVEALEPEALGTDVALKPNCPVSRIWDEVQQASRGILQKTTLESLASSSEPMFYI